MKLGGIFNKKREEGKDELLELRKEAMKATMAMVASTKYRWAVLDALLKIHPQIGNDKRVIEALNKVMELKEATNGD